MRWLALIALIGLVACGNERDDRNGLCGVAGLEGERIADVVGRGACGIDDPVLVTRVAGVDLSRPARMTCEAASALDGWVTRGAKPILRGAGGGLSELRVAAGYACRTRNSRPGARLSEHARGNAIDISAFTLNDGSTLTVTEDWRSDNRRIMRRLHRSACGPFSTVIGPDGDRFHQNHFHLDVADYGGGTYCR